MVTQTGPDEVREVRQTELEKTPANDPGSPRHRFSDVYREIEALEKLRTGWDSYAAPAISPQARQRAAGFVSMLVTHLDRQVTAPSVGPIPTGGVMLKWVTEKHEVEITFLPEGGEYSVVDRGADRIIAEGVIGRSEGVLRDVVQRQKVVDEHRSPQWEDRTWIESR